MEEDIAIPSPTKQPEEGTVIPFATKQPLYPVLIDCFTVRFFKKGLARKQQSGAVNFAAFCDHFNRKKLIPFLTGLGFHGDQVLDYMEHFQGVVSKFEKK